jgi:hypothetical protein
MATLKPTLTLASNDISTTEALNLTITGDIAVSGPCTTVIVPVSTNAKTIVTLGTSASIVFAYNTSANSTVFMSYGTPTISAGHMKLGPGEFALIPHNTGTDLKAIASSGTADLEIRKYQIAI